MIEALSAQWAVLPDRLLGHVRLTLCALMIGTLISVALGMVASRVRALQTPVLTIASIVQTIPGLALLAIMVPILGMINETPALIALILYSMLPILRNTVTGLDAVDADVIEAAQGVGMTGNQILWRVRLPLAAPVIIAGIRTAAVWTVGMATLATPVGAISLGNYIFEGLQTMNNAAIVVGCVACSILALVLDGIIRGLEAAAVRRNRFWIWTLTVALIGTTVGVLADGLIDRSAASSGQTVRIGAKTFTEQYILGELMQQKIERDCSVRVTVQAGLGSTIAFDALRQNEIDVYVDYSGTIWTNVLKRRTGQTDASAMNATITREMKDRDGIVVVGVLGFENAYCLAMRRGRAEQLGISTLSQLFRRSSELTLGADMAFLGRAEYSDIVSRHHAAFRQVRAMEAVLMYRAIAEDQVDVISAYTTEGKIETFDLLVLDDDLSVFPPYDAMILVSPRAAAEKSAVVRSLLGLVNRIDHRMMLRANWRVDHEHESPRAVARDMLEQITSRE